MRNTALTVTRPVALVTSGAHGMGAAIVRRLAADGHQVMIADIDTTEGTRLADAVGGRFVRTDVGSLGDNQCAVAEAVRHFGDLDTVCLNAGISGGASIGDDFDPGRYRESMRVNLDGVVYGMNAAPAGAPDLAAAAPYWSPPAWPAWRPPPTCTTGRRNTP